jgi:TRAP-type C4-dicarboxylate transport system permease small subunit
MADAGARPASSALSERIMAGLSVAAAVAAAVMMLATAADVLMANVFNRPIVGTFDVVETMLPCVVFLGIPQTFLSEGNITVDIVDHVVGARGVIALRLLGGVAAMAFLAVTLWQMLGAAHDAYVFGDRKPDLPIPLFAIWIPVLIGTAFALVAAAISVWRRFGDLRPGRRHQI